MFGSKKIIGLDIGTSSIKVAEMDIGSNGGQLVSFGFKPTPPGSINAGEIADAPAISATVKILLKEAKIKKSNMGMGMWGTAVIVKKITVPRMEKKLLPEHLKFEAEQYIPFDINQISIAHHILEAQPASDSMDLLLVGAQNDFISLYDRVAVGAGVKCSVLDVNGFALANIFEFNYGRVPETVGLFNFGASTTNFVVISNGDVLFCRDIPVGGFNFTNEIHKNLGVTIPEAESLKLASAGPDVAEEVRNTMSVALEQVVEEIRNSLEFFHATSNGVMISRCLYTGGSAATLGLIDAISKVTSLNFEPLNPFLRIKSSKKMSPEYLSRVAPFISIALGLSLRKAGEK